jgi:DNA-binding ferritin-like protein
MTENIVNFPNKGPEMFPSTIEESLDHIQSVRQEYCDEVADDVFEAMASVLSTYGFVVRMNESHIKDFTFAEETIKALVYRYKRIGHPFHEIIDNVITISDEVQQDLEKAKEKEQQENNLTS